MQLESCLLRKTARGHTPARLHQQKDRRSQALWRHCLLTWLLTATRENQSRLHKGQMVLAAHRQVAFRLRVVHLRSIAVCLQAGHTSVNLFRRLPLPLAQLSGDRQPVFAVGSLPRHPYPLFDQCIMRSITIATPRLLRLPLPTRSLPTCPRRRCKPAAVHTTLLRFCRPLQLQ